MCLMDDLFGFLPSVELMFHYCLYIAVCMCQHFVLFLNFLMYIIASFTYQVNKENYWVTKDWLQSEAVNFVRLKVIYSGL